MIDSGKILWIKKWITMEISIFNRIFHVRPLSFFRFIQNFTFNIIFVFWCPLFHLFIFLLHLSAYIFSLFTLFHLVIAWWALLVFLSLHWLSIFQLFWEPNHHYTMKPSVYIPELLWCSLFESGLESSGTNFFFPQVHQIGFVGHSKLMDSFFKFNDFLKIALAFLKLDHLFKNIFF